MLYSFNNTLPAPLPFRIWMPDGFTRTDPSSFTEDELSAAGFTGPYIEPPYDPATQRLAWVDGAYVIEQLPPPPIVPNYQGFYDALLVSEAYNLVLQQVMNANTPGPAAALAVLISALQDALNDRANPNALQSSIWLLLGQLTLPPEAAVELQSLLNDNNLADLYVLTPPDPEPEPEPEPAPQPEP